MPMVFRFVQYRGIRLFPVLLLTAWAERLLPGKTIAEQRRQYTLSESTLWVSDNGKLMECRFALKVILLWLPRLLPQQKVRPLLHGRMEIQVAIGISMH